MKISKRDHTNRVNELADLIVHHKQAYYAGKPEISDASYDALEDELAQLVPDHPALSYVGTEPAITGLKVNHEVPMLSLNKTYSVDDLVAWQNGQELVGMLKVDGVSLALVYEDGQLAVAKTRGNGRVGEDVTQKALWIAEVPHHIPLPKGRVEIRGEVYCTETDFLKLCDVMVGLQLERPSSPRNIVAGVLGRKSNIHLSRYFRFFAFDVLSDEDDATFDLEMDKFAWLQDVGFQLPRPQLIRTEAEVAAYLESVRQAMEEGEIGLDGAVCAYNRLSLHRELGNTAHHPRAKMAFKWQGSTAITTIENVTWSTSRLGIVTPVAVIDPVYLSGAKITNVTLHNAALVKTFNLKQGDRIEVVRSGEVIPKFLAVVEAKPGSYEWPPHCPSCDSALEFDDVRLKCTNTNDCPAQVTRSILNWIRSAEIDDLSEKRLNALIDSGLVKEIPDLYRLSAADFLTLPLTKEKMANKLFANIEASRTLPLHRFLNGLGIEGAGLNTWEKLLQHFPSLVTLQKATVDDIQGIDGFAEKSAEQLVTGLAQKQPLIAALMDVGVKPFFAASKTEGTEGPLAGKTVVITGTLSRPRKDIEALIKSAGGSVTSAVSKNTAAVITNDTDSGSSKMKKARQLNIPIWNEDELQKQISG